MVTLRNWAWGSHGPQPVPPDIEAPPPDIIHPPFRPSGPQPPDPHGLYYETPAFVTNQFVQHRVQAVTGHASDSPFTEQEQAEMRAEAHQTIQILIEQERQSVLHNTAIDHDLLVASSYNTPNWANLRWETRLLNAQINKENPFKLLTQPGHPDHEYELELNNKWTISWLLGHERTSPSFELRSMIMNHQRMLRELVDANIPIPEEYYTIIELTWGLVTPPWEY